MCGIIGIVGTTEVASALYDGLTVLQHRGQDAAGIAGRSQLGCAAPEFLNTSPEAGNNHVRNHRHCRYHRSGIGAL